MQFHAIATAPGPTTLYEPPCTPCAQRSQQPWQLLSRASARLTVYAGSPEQSSASSYTSRSVGGASGLVRSLHEASALVIFFMQRIWSSGLAVPPLPQLKWKRLLPSARKQPCGRFSAQKSHLLLM